MICYNFKLKFCINIGLENLYLYIKHHNNIINIFTFSPYKMSKNKIHTFKLCGYKFLQYFEFTLFIYKQSA